MAVSTLSSDHRTGRYMPMTTAGINCPAPMLEENVDDCQIPGGRQFWRDGGFYSPGVCFIGYEPLCTQTSATGSEWPIQKGETVVRCIPSDYACQPRGEDQRYATTDFGGNVLSVPAFEIRWRKEDLQSGTVNLPPPGVQTLTPATAYKTSTHSTQPPTSLYTTTASPTSHSLSAAAIGGIAVGSLVGLLAVLVAGVLLRKKQNNAKSENRVVEIDGDTSRTVELESKPMPPKELAADAPISPLSRNSHFNGDLTQASINSTPVELDSEPMRSPNSASG